MWSLVFQSLEYNVLLAITPIHWFWILCLKENRARGKIKVLKLHSTPMVKRCAPMPWRIPSAGWLNPLNVSRKVKRKENSAREHQNKNHSLISICGCLPLTRVCNSNVKTTSPGNVLQKLYRNDLISAGHTAALIWCMLSIIPARSSHPAARAPPRTLCSGTASVHLTEHSTLSAYKLLIFPPRQQWRCTSVIISHYCH